MPKRGPKENYDPEIDLCTIALYAERGATDAKIARALGISRQHFIVWKKKYHEIADTLKKPKQIADDRVVNSLYRRANGFTVQEKKVERHPDGKDRITITEKYVAPDPTSMIFWLKNRRPAEWRDKKEFTFSDYADEIDALNKDLKKAAAAKAAKKNKSVRKK